jgi:hypothetical protein
VSILFMNEIPSHKILRMKIKKWKFPFKQRHWFNDELFIQYHLSNFLFLRNQWRKDVMKKKSMKIYDEEFLSMTKLKLRCSHFLWFNSPTFCIGCSSGFCPKTRHDSISALKKPKFKTFNKKKVQKSGTLKILGRIFFKKGMFGWRICRWAAYS